MKISVVKTMGIGALTVLCFGPANAQDAAGPPVLAKQLAPARGGARLRVTSDAFLSGGTIDERYTQNGENVSPPVAWTRGPTGTLSYAIIIEDAGVKRAEPVTHWIVYNLPSTRNRITENQPAQAQIDAGALQGLNVRKAAGFVGPKPPAGETHPYHIQVFALNTRLKLNPAEADRDDVVKAMKGHVLASGDLVVTYTGK